MTGAAPPRLALSLSVAVLVLGIGAGCSGGGEQRPFPAISEATAEREVVRGEARASSTVTLRFDREFVIASDRLPLASYFEIEAPQLSGTRRLLPQSARVEAGNRRIVILEVNALVPEGATVRVARKAFRAGATGELTAEVESDLSPAQVLLATRPFTFENLELIADGGQPLPAAADRDPAAMQRRLVEHLAARGASDEVAARAVARYQAIPEDIVSSPKLRAALAALTGTFADATPGYLVTGTNCTNRPAARVAFEVPPDYPQLLARSTRDATGRRVISVHPRLEGEPLELLMPLLAHESVHCDERDSRYEEIAATAFDTLLYLQLLPRFPALARSGTQLAREFNIDALAMFNSGRRFPESGGILPSFGTGEVLPGSGLPYRSFAELVAAAYPGVTDDRSPTEALAVAFAGQLAGSLDAPEGDPFDLVYLDELVSRAFSVEMITTALEALELEPG